MAELKFKNTFLTVEPAVSPTFQRQSSAPSLMDSWLEPLAAESRAEKEAIEKDVKGLLEKSGLMLNVGSIAHPELCARPCAFFAAGKCTDGAACRLCHTLHEKTSTYDKRQRAAWRELSRHEVLWCLHTCLHARAQKIGWVEEIQPVLQLLEEERKVLAPEAPQTNLTKTQHKTLLKYFAKRRAWQMIQEALQHSSMGRTLLAKVQGLLAEMRLEVATWP